MESQAAEKTKMIFIGFASSDIAIEWDDSTVLYNVPGQVFSSAEGWSRIFQTNQVTFVIKSTTHLLLGLCWRTHSRISMLLIWSYKRPKSSWLQTRNGCSNTKLLLADGWWYCRAPVSVLRKIKPNDKLILKMVGWSSKIRLSCSRRLAGLMVDRRKLYQSWSLLWRLNRVRTCGQCCRYVWAISSSELETRFEGIRTESASQLEPLLTVSKGSQRANLFASPYN